MKKTKNTNTNNEVKETTPEEYVEVLDQDVVLDAGNPTTEAQPDPTVLLQTEVDNLKKEREELIEKIKYSQAELISYRMRKDEETASLLKYANQDLITELLPIIDNFESALKLASKSTNPEISKYLTGFQMMHQNLLSILNKYGVEEINRVGQVFDSNQEQALVADHDESQPDEIVLEVLQKGYKLKDRVIRPASVRVNQL